MVSWRGLKCLALSSLITLSALSLAAPLARRGTLGIPLRQVPKETRDKHKLGPQEALLVSTDGNGLVANDLILAVKGKRFKSFADFNDSLRSEATKPRTTLTVLRDGKEQEVEVAIQPKPKDDTDKYETIYDQVTSKGNNIRTFVTKPKTPGKRPVLFYFQGIGTGSVDYPLSTQNYLARILNAFSEDFVTVRVEKPGVGDSEGGPAKMVGYEEELDIYRQALKSLAKYDFVDKDNIFIFGHSMGGCHAPLICQEQPVRGVISYGTVSNSWLEWEIRSPRIQGPLGGQSRAEVDQVVRQQTGFYHFLFTEKKSVDWIKQNKPELKKFAEESSPDSIMLGDRTIKYMQELNDHNFCEAWTKMGETRVLALFGENDWISLVEDQTQVADAVNAAHPGYAEYKVVPASDHGFSKSTSMKDSFDRFGKPGAEFNPVIITMMKEWIAKTRKTN